MILPDEQMPEMDGFTVPEPIKQAPELRDATTMMLTSDNQRGDTGRCWELGIAQCALKPVTQPGLLDAGMTALGSANPNEERSFKIASDSRESNSLRVLLAEDSAVNQQIATRLLRKLGHIVVVAANGHEAMSAIESDRFDVVLMDVQMPGMTGFEATRLIRERELESGGHIPIIAITAHVTIEDRARCLDVGMDDYISKPIYPQDLFCAIDKLITASAKPEECEITRNQSVVADLSTLLESLDHNVELLGDLVNICVEDSTRLLNQIREAIAGRDSGALERAAHSLRGLVANFHADAAANAAERLEDLGSQGDFIQAQVALAALEHELERLKPALILFVMENAE